MKIIISESKLKSLIKKFLFKHLGSYSKGKSRWVIGNFHNSYGEKMGEIKSGRFSIDEDLYFMMVDMFNIQYGDLDQIIIDAINEMDPSYNVKDVVIGKYNN